MTVVQNLSILKIPCQIPRTLKAIVKWRNHPNILALVSEHKNMAKLF